MEDSLCVEICKFAWDTQKKLANVFRDHERTIPET